MFTTSELAGMVWWKNRSITDRTLRLWVERGWIEATQLSGGRYFVFTEDQVADFLIGRLDEVASWAKGERPGPRPRRYWELRRSGYYLRVALHAKIEWAEHGHLPYKAKTWYIGWFGHVNEKQRERMVRTQRSDVFRRFILEALTEMQRLDAWRKGQELNSWHLNQRWQTEE